MRKSDDSYSKDIRGPCILTARAYIISHTTLYKHSAYSLAYDVTLL